MRRGQKDGCGVEAMMRVVCVGVATTDPRNAAIMHLQPFWSGYLVRYFYEEDWARAAAIAALAAKQDASDA